MRFATLRWFVHRGTSPEEHQAWGWLALASSVAGGSLAIEEGCHEELCTHRRCPSQLEKENRVADQEREEPEETCRLLHVFQLIRLRMGLASWKAVTFVDH